MSELPISSHVSTMPEEAKALYCQDLAWGFFGRDSAWRRAIVAAVRRLPHRPAWGPLLLGEGWEAWARQLSRADAPATRWVLFAELLQTPSPASLQTLSAVAREHCVLGVVPSSAEDPQHLRRLCYAVGVPWVESRIEHAPRLVASAVRAAERLTREARLRAWTDPSHSHSVTALPKAKLFAERALTPAFRRCAEGDEPHNPPTLGPQASP